VGWEEPLQKLILFRYKHQLTAMLEDTGVEVYLCLISVALPFNVITLLLLFKMEKKSFSAFTLFLKKKFSSCLVWWDILALDCLPSFLRFLYCYGLVFQPLFIKPHSIVLFACFVTFKQAIKYTIQNCAFYVYWCKPSITTKPRNSPLYPFHQFWFPTGWNILASDFLPSAIPSLFC
jgi:hypothetical protein